MKNMVIILFWDVVYFSTYDWGKLNGGQVYVAKVVRVYEVPS